jgi:multicomponent Na+:H+ antiporter subunit B
MEPLHVMDPIIMELIIAGLFLFAGVAAVVALVLRDLLAASVALSTFSFVVALLYVVMGAVDVGFNEAVLGAGVTGTLVVVAVFRTRRGSMD